MLWGFIGDRRGIEIALVCAGVGAIAATALGFVWKLPDAPGDVSPWNHWLMPVLIDGDKPDLQDGPVLITVEYIVGPEHAAEFLDAMRKYERVRRRDGASRWGIFHDTEAGDRYVETFLVHSWAEHLRQHARQTLGDRKLEHQVHSYARREPKVQHLIYATSGSSCHRPFITMLASVETHNTSCINIRRKSLLFIVFFSMVVANLSS
jgi:hypothetical protein